MNISWDTFLTQFPGDWMYLAQKEMTMSSSSKRAIVLLGALEVGIPLILT